MSVAEGLRCREFNRRGDFVVEAVSKTVEIPSVYIQRQKSKILFVDTGVNRKIVMSLPRVRWLERGANNG